MKQIILAISLACLAMPAIALSETISREGYYESEDGQSLTAELTPLSDNRYMLSLSTTVPVKGTQPGCGGSLQGEVVVDGNTATFTLPNEGFNAQEKESLSNSKFCKVNLKFSGDFGLDLEEVSGCSYYHGASCSFSGSVLHEASGI